MGKGTTRRSDSAEPSGMKLSCQVTQRLGEPVQAASGAD